MLFEINQLAVDINKWMAMRPDNVLFFQSVRKRGIFGVTQNPLRKIFHSPVSDRWFVCLFACLVDGSLVS
jgi:hypothetical protein